MLRPRLLPLLEPPRAPEHGDHGLAVAPVLDRQDRPHDEHRRVPDDAVRAHLLLDAPLQEDGESGDRQRVVPRRHVRREVHAEPVHLAEVRRVPVQGQLERRPARRVVAELAVQLVPLHGVVERQEGQDVAVVRQRRHVELAAAVAALGV